jgi:ribosomal 50S subunit-recycling heat shock protein
MVEKKSIGVVSNYFDKVKVAAIKLQKGVKTGDKIRIVGGEEEFEQVIKSMQINRKPIKKAKTEDEIGVKVKRKVRKGYKVFKA